MSTSGTIGTTKINTSRIIEKALRRCGVPLGKITPEILNTAAENLYLFLLSMSGRGLNLWCVDKQMMGMQQGQASYILPPGTLGVLNLLLATVQETSGTRTSGGTFTQETFTDPVGIVRLGLRFSSDPGTVTFKYSTDGGTTISSVSLSGTWDFTVWNWVDLPRKLVGNWIQVAVFNSGTMSNVRFATDVREISLSQLNRDDFVNQPNKNIQSYVSTNYYFEKLINPQITVWPVPNSDQTHLVLYRHRQVQDVGLLTQELEIPGRWMEAVIWQLAVRMAFELPELVQDARRGEVIQMAQASLAEVELTETDGSPVYLRPQIDPYTA